MTLIKQRPWRRFGTTAEVLCTKAEGGPRGTEGLDPGHEHKTHKQCISSAFAKQTRLGRVPAGLGFFRQEVRLPPAG